MASNTNASTQTGCTPKAPIVIEDETPECLIIHDSKLSNAPRRATKRVSTLRLETDVPMKRKLFQPTKRHIRIHLGRDRYLSTSTYNNEQKIHLRVFDGDIPQKKGVTLGIRQARNLIDCIGSADAQATAEWTDLPSEAKPESFHHLGYGLYLKIYVFNGQRFYDVRRYWRPFSEPNAVPTKAGLNMNSEELKKLIASVPALEETLPELRDVQTCDCQMQGNQLASLRCTECNPFDCHSW